MQINSTRLQHQLSFASGTAHTGVARMPGPSDSVSLGQPIAVPTMKLQQLAQATKNTLAPLRVKLMGGAVAASLLPAALGSPAYAASRDTIGAPLDIRSVITSIFSPGNQEPAPEAQPAQTPSFKAPVPQKRPTSAAPYGTLDGAKTLSGAPVPSKRPAAQPQPQSIPAEMFTTTGDPADVARAHSGTPKSSETSLHAGMSGPAVARFQQGLSAYESVEVTGTYDAQTEAAVRAFQRDNKLPETGEAGNMTKAQLWNKTFWEKGKALDFNGPEVVQNAPAHVKLRVDLKAQRVFVLDAETGDVYKSYPVSSGSAKHPTPREHFRITDVTEKPSWIPPTSSAWAKNAKVAGPGPNNPLGPVKLRLNGSSVLFHGVPRKEWSGIGHQAESHGCMRMFPQDAWELHKIVPVGTEGDIN